MSRNTWEVLNSMSNNQETSLLSSLLPGCDQSYVYLTLAYTTSQIHSVLGRGYGHRLVANPQCMYGGCTRHGSFLSWIHIVFLVAMSLLMESSMDLRCIIGSCAQSSFLSMYNSSPSAFFGTGLMVIALHRPLPPPPRQFYLYKVFRPSHISSDLTLQGASVTQENPPLVGKKNCLAEEHFSLCEIRSTRPLQG